MLVVWLMVTGCDPLGTDDTTTTTTSTTSSTTTTTTAVPSDVVYVSTLDDLNNNLVPGRHVVVVSSLATNESLILPDNFTLEFQNGAGLSRTDDALGAAIDIASNNVTVRDAAVLGTNPCYWTNNLPYNPDSIGEMYSQWTADKDAAGIRMEEHAAVYIRPGAKNVTIDGLVAHDVWGDGITVSGGQDINLFGIAVRCAGRSGLSITEGQNVRLNGGMFSGMFWWGINIESFGSKVVEGVTAQNTTIGYTRYPWFQAGLGEGANCQITDVDVQDVTLLPSSSRPSRTSRCVYSEVRLPPSDHHP